jgi:hypothetical protein
MIQRAAELLGVSESTLSPFALPDAFNGGQEIAGFISQQSDHRYGALVITRVAGEDVTPQVIFATPKLHYPFDRTEERSGRKYKFPKVQALLVYEKLDGCFAYHTPIRLSDGTKKPIGQIVNQDLRPVVWSYDENTGEVVPQQVTAVHKYPATKARVRISYKKVRWQRGPSVLVCTADHRLLTPEGWSEASSLLPGSKVLRFCPHLPSQMHDFMVGALLGDASIWVPSRDKEGHQVGNPNVGFGHGEAQKDYLFLKYRLLQHYAREAPESRQGGYANTLKWVFSTKSHPALLDLYESFISEGVKRIPTEIRISPLALAIWYLDDGSISVGESHRPKATFHTQSFTFSDVERLLESLNRTYGLTGRVHDYGKGPQLEMTADASEILFGLVAPYIPPCLQYKVPESYRVPLSYLEQMEPFGEELGYRTVEIVSVEPYTPSGSQLTDSYVYDLTVANTSCYFAGDLLAHNSNICAYSYANAQGTRFVTFKTRLVPILSDSRFGSFRQMWQELLKNNVALRDLCETVRNGEWALSFEMYGYRNKHLIIYPEPLVTKLLFAVREQDAAVMPPEMVAGDGHPDALHPVARLTSSEDIVAFYEAKREEAESQNKKIIDGDDESIEGMEGFIFYIQEPTGRWSQWKCKASGVEDIHWVSDTIPMSRILPTVWNALESCDELTAEYIRKLLLEEFSRAQVDSSSLRIEKAVALVTSKLAWQTKVRAAYEATGMDLIRDGRGMVMRALSQSFDRGDMKRVYSALREMGLAETN